MKVKGKEKQHPSPPRHSLPNLSSSSLLSQIRSSCSLASHSEASLAASSSYSATGGPDVRPTSVVAKNWSTAWLHRSSASSSAMLVRSRRRVGPGSFVVSLRTVVQRVFCWHRHWGQSLNRCYRVWMLYWHHQQVASGRRVVHARCWPVKQYPVLNW